MLRCMQNDSSYQMPKRILAHESVLQFCKKLSEGAKDGQYKKVLVNMGTRGLFTTTVLVSGSDQGLATRPENIF